MLYQVTILVLVVMSQSQAFYGGSYSRTTRHARCSGSNVPCRLSFQLNNRTTNALISRSASQQCSCNTNYNGQGQCSSDWSNTNYVINRNLRSENLDVTLKMMFCRPVTPASVCTSNQVALEISGWLTIPNTLDHYNCRCNNNNPLYLVQRSVVNNRFSHKYVCSNSFPSCGTNKCMTVTSSRTNYHCKCASNQKCQMTGTWTANTIETIVYCSSR